FSISIYYFMPAVNRITKSITHKGKKAILKKELKLIENAKEYDLKKPNVQMMKQKNDVLSFEDITPIEKFAFKYTATHNKKHPHNLIMGRMYVIRHEHMLLDMIEFGLENYKGLKDFKVEKITSGIKPLLIFNGELFESNREYGRIKNLLIDMFLREEVQKIRLQGLEHVCDLNLLKKSNMRTPRIELEEIGPRADLVCRRNKFASEDLFNRACRKPNALKAKTKKNISKDTFGTTYGRIHIGAQNIGIQTRKMKGLKKTLSEKNKREKRKIADDNNDGAKKLKETSH
ncbi:RPF2 factor, partial [Acromyrmex charruanus]